MHHLQQIGVLPHSTPSICTLHQLRASYEPLLQTHTFPPPLPLCSHRDSAPTQLLLNSHAAIKLQMCHLSRGTVTDANLRVDSLQHVGTRATSSALLLPACRGTRPPTSSSSLTAASSPRAPTSRTWKRVSKDPPPWRGRLRQQHPVQQLHDF